MTYHFRRCGVDHYIEIDTDEGGRLLRSWRFWASLEPAGREV